MTMSTDILPTRRAISASRLRSNQRVLTDSSDDNPNSRLSFFLHHISYEGTTRGAKKLLSSSFVHKYGMYRLEKVTEDICPSCDLAKILPIYYTFPVRPSVYRLDQSFEF